MGAYVLVLVALAWSARANGVSLREYEDANLRALRALIAEGRLPPSGELSETRQQEQQEQQQEQQEQQELDPAFILPIFHESYRLQASGDDIISAAEGFDAVARARRGDPWPGRNLAAADPRCSSVGEGAIMRGGFVGDDRGRGGSNSNNIIKDNTNDAYYCVEAFLDAHRSTVEEFSRRTHILSSGGYSELPSAWGHDTLAASTRGNTVVTALHKLDHDREQLEYLIANKRLPKGFQELADDYVAVREMITDAMMIAEKPGATEDNMRGAYYALGLIHVKRLRGAYNTLLYVPPGPADVLGGTHPTGYRRALNPNLDWRAVEEDYLSKETPVLWFDGFLTPEALEGVLQYCREATVFFDVKIGYLGAYLNDGFSSPWVLQIARELQERLPRVLEGMTLVNLWAYKFDSDTSMEGISVHADSASVNLNFWVTPDDANLDPDSGGLVVYPRAPPRSGMVEGEARSDKDDKAEDIKIWNNIAMKSFVHKWLEDEGVFDLAVRVPYRQNRMVMFDSRLLHETDTFRFKKGYENRRINLTFLFSPATKENP